MESVLVKLFAAALTLSQVTTAPDALKTHFDRAQDQQQVAELLHAGCEHMLEAFDLESINIDDLISTALDDPQAIGGSKAFHGINFADLQTAYREFCKNEKVPAPAVDLGAVIDFYDKAAADLPDEHKLKGLELPGASVVLDRRGGRFAEVFEQNERRVWVPLSDIPEHVQKAFVAAEDKRFYQHKGVDEHGLIRAFVGNLGGSGRPQGGSTITQQIVKNLLVGDDLTYERKIREMIVASRVESTLGKDEILELYLNSVYLGRNAWGIEQAAQSYFGKPAKELTLEEGALLAGLTKGPSYYSPDRYPQRARERLAYVLGRLGEDGVIAAAPSGSALPSLPAMRPYQPHRDIGFYFMDQVAREAKSLAGIEAITASSYTVRSTIQPQLQRATEEALQEGLWRYERDAGRLRFRAPEGNLAKAIERIEAREHPAEPAPPAAAPASAAEQVAGAHRHADPDGKERRTPGGHFVPPSTTGRAGDGNRRRPAWQRALAQARLPLYDVHWTPGVVLATPKGARRGESWRVGLSDGRILPLAVNNAEAARRLALHDVVFVHVSAGRGGARAELRIRPQVQGMVVVLENKSGRILAMTGGFSYPLSQLNRATQSVRQPGSAIKPLSYLAALGRGLQPNTLVQDEAITLPPPGGRRHGERWTPRNYDGGERGTITMRQALENSRNLATVHLLQGGIADTPEASLDRLCELALEAQIYRDCVHYYPFMLGAQPVRPIDLAAFYAAIANEGVRPTPYVVDSIERNGRTLFRHTPAPTAIGSVDHAAFYQLKTMLQGVVAHGTASAIASLSPFVAGKTGTTEDENDAWFVGFTNDVTVAVWIGYDNSGGKRRTLGGGVTGGGVAVPIFEPVIQAVWAHVAPKTALAPPSAEAKRQLACSGTDSDSRGRRRGARELDECLRIDAKGKIADTQYRLVSRRRAYAKDDDDDAPRRRERRRDVEDDSRNSYAYDRGRVSPFWGWQQRWGGSPSRYYSRGGGGEGFSLREQPREWRGRPMDPGYFWGRREW
jgi:1A family penicillin-binding protein